MIHFHGKPLDYWLAPMTLEEVEQCSANMALARKEPYVAAMLSMPTNDVQPLSSVSAKYAPFTNYSDEFMHRIALDCLWSFKRESGASSTLLLKTHRNQEHPSPAIAHACANSPDYRHEADELLRSLNERSPSAARLANRFFIVGCITALEFLAECTALNRDDERLLLIDFAYRLFCAGMPCSLYHLEALAMLESVMDEFMSGENYDSGYLGASPD